MTIQVAQRLMTVDEFLQWVPEGEKWELIGGVPVRKADTFLTLPDNGLPIPKMVGESRLHAQVKTNVASALGRHLRPPSPCRPQTDSLTIPVAHDFVYRPDVYIDCGAFDDLQSQTAQTPTVVFEVSVTSLDYDMTYKRVGYFTVDSVQHVVIIDANARAVHHFVRDARDIITLTVDDALSLTLPTRALDLPIAEFFEWL